MADELIKRMLGLGYSCKQLLVHAKKKKIQRIHIWKQDD
jgi:hypothetical protein